MTNDELIHDYLDGIDAQQAQRDIDAMPPEPPTLTYDELLALYNDLSVNYAQMTINCAYWAERYKQLKQTQTPRLDVWLGDDNV